MSVCMTTVLVLLGRSVEAMAVPAPTIRARSGQRRVRKDACSAFLARGAGLTRFRGDRLGEGAVLVQHLPDPGTGLGVRWHFPQSEPGADDADGGTGDRGGRDVQRQSVHRALR